MNLESRLTALERSNRRLQRTVRALALVIVAALVAGARGGDVVDVLRARRIEIVGERGGPLVVLTQEAGHGVAALLDDGGNWKVQLNALSGGGTITTKGARGEELVTVGFDDRGNGALRTASASGTPLTALTIVEGDGAIITYDEAGREHVKLATAYSGAGSVTTFGGDGRRLMQLTASTKGDGLLAAFSPDGRVRASWP
jgi:hypothetical protein